MTHPLLEKITIKFNDTKKLKGFRKWLYYFGFKYQELFVKRKQYLKYFQSIEIVLKQVEKPITWPQYFHTGKRIYHNKEYSIHDSVVEITKDEIQFDRVNLAISLDTIHANVYNWLYRMEQAQQAQQAQHEPKPITDKKIIFACW